MRLNDEIVLQGLNYQASDLSSDRPFVEQGAYANQDRAALSRSTLETRGFLSRPSRSRRRASESQASTSTSSKAQEGVAQVGLEQPPVIWVPFATLPGGGFEVLQKFEGTVVAVESDSFVARLVDKTNPGPEEEAEIPLAEIMAGDRELVEPGAIFYWVIGYRREPHGQLSRSSVIRFRRLPFWSQSEIDRAQKTAENFLSFLDLDRANNPA